MEFRYRSGEERPPSFRPSSSPAPPDGFFGPQSLPGGFGMGGEIGRAGDMIFHQASALASLRRELQKERIREEIIAQEIEERRVLEAEVRRELEMERAMGIRHIPLVDQLMLNSVPAKRMLVEQFVPGPVGAVSEAGIVEGSPHQVNPNVMVGKELALVHHDGGLKSGKQVGKELALVHHDGDLKNDKLSPAIEVKSFQSKLFGIKRKGEAPAAVAGKSKVPRSDQQSWNCALCQVSTTSETGLKAHLQGKKHQATVAKLGTHDTSRANKSGGHFVSMPKNTSLLKSQKNSAQGGSTYRPQKVNIMIDGKVHYVIQKKTHMWCGACKVRCNSTAVMVEHLSGKRHTARMEELSKDRKHVITTAATTSMEAVEKEPACIETTAEEDMSMAASLVEEVKDEYESSTAGEAGDEPVGVTS